MSATFTNNKYNATAAIKDVGVDTSQPIGTVIYIPASGDANICNQTTTSDLEYTIGSNTLKINSPSLTGLNKEKYYVVIDGDPCSKSVTKKFFDCQPPGVAPKPTAVPTAVSTAVSTPVSTAAPAAAPAAAAALVSALAITKVVRFNTATIDGMFNVKSEVYVCPAVNAKGGCIANCLFKTDIPLNTIFKKHYEKQVEIVDSLKTETNLADINTLHEFINGLYNYVNTTTTLDFTAFNNEYANIVTKVSITDALMQLQSNFRTSIFNKATTDTHKIEKDSKDRYDNLLVTYDTINSKLPKITTDTAKMKYILMESINNFFYILLFKLVDKSTITVEYTTPNITSVKVNKIPILLSKLNNVDAKIHIKYYLSAENITNGNDKPHIFYKGIDTSILAEVDITDTKTLTCSSTATSIMIEANLIKYEFTKVLVKGISTIKGGSHKTKKRNQISKKQIRKTKKQSRK